MDQRQSTSKFRLMAFFRPTSKFYGLTLPRYPRQNLTHVTYESTNPRYSHNPQTQITI